MAEATASSCDDSTRYALGCVLLKGSTGEIVATDGHQLLIQGGYCLPWSGDVLIRRSRVFASKALPRDLPLEVGKTASHVVLKSGPWTIFLEVQTEGTVPRRRQGHPGRRDVAHPPASRRRRRAIPACRRLIGCPVGRRTTPPPRWISTGRWPSARRGRVSPGRPSWCCHAPGTTARRSG